MKSEPDRRSSRTVAANSALCSTPGAASPKLPDAPITDEDARLLGGMTHMILAGCYPEPRKRLQISTKDPMQWGAQDDSARDATPREGTD